MKHCHLITLVLLAAPALASAQVKPVLPKEPIGAKIPFDLLDELKLKGDYKLVMPEGVLKDALFDYKYALQEPKLQHLETKLESLHVLQDHQLFKYVGSHTMEMPHPTAAYQEDPADSLFRAASSFFSRQEYGQAATRFSDLRTKYPNSRYWCDAAYYEGFSRQRMGGANDLRTGYRVLESMAGRCNNSVRGGSTDVPQLKARIDGNLAKLGDAEANARVRAAVSQGQSVCDSDERAVKIEALNTLAQMDPATANPALRAVLATKDPCSAPIRSQAISLVSRRNDSESVALLLQIAKSDSDANLRREAVSALSRMTNDAAVAAMEDLLRSSTDERVQSEVAMAMARSDNPRAQAAVRALIERKDVSERIRLNAINGLASKPITLDYWKALYVKLDTDPLRATVINAIARVDTDEASQYVLSIAKNPQESSETRRAALGKVYTTAPIAELYRLLSTVDSRSFRQSIVRSIAARKEPEATDRLIDIAKTFRSDPEVVREAINALGQGTRKNDPKVIAALRDIISGT